MDITFINTMPQVATEEYAPRPASKYIPDWYKKTDSYLNEKKEVWGPGGLSGTIKRCMPVFDSITAGYIIPTYVDLHIKQNGEDTPFFTWAWTQEAVGFHETWQAEFHPDKNAPWKIAKWHNPWAIKTSPGYSCLFIPPMHQDNKYFKILPGIVDTDKYHVPVNFPFFFTDPKFEGIIPAGTPLAQIIPIKRDNCKMTITDDISVTNKHLDKLKSVFFDSYKRNFRSDKNNQYK